jgi:2-dehydropantoate 2-reductase
MRFLIAGAGAVGGFVGARLAGAGQDVTLLVRPPRVAGLRENGLRVTGPDGTRTVRPSVVTAAQLGPGYDAIVLAVKSEDGVLAQVMDDIAPAVTPPAMIVPFLNGMAHIGRLTARFGAAAVVGGTLRVATEAEDDGSIRVLSPEFRVEVGELDGSASTRVTDLAAAFGTAGAQVAVSDDIIGAMWAKWVFIASIGAVTSLMRATAGEIVAVPGGDRFARSVIAEAAGTAAAVGHPAPVDVLRATEQALTTPGSPATSSLSRDLSMNRPTEVEAVLADLADRARAVGTATPLIDLAVLALRIHNRRLSG